MHISNAQISKVFELHMHKVSGFTMRPISRVQVADQFVISRQATEMHGIKQFVSALPEVRQDRVHEFQSAIESGSYQVSDTDLATAMLASTIAGRVGR